MVTVRQDDVTERRTGCSARARSGLCQRTDYRIVKILDLKAELPHHTGYASVFTVLNHVSY